MSFRQIRRDQPDRRPFSNKGCNKIINRCPRANIHPHSRFIKQADQSHATGCGPASVSAGYRRKTGPLPGPDAAASDAGGPRRPADAASALRSRNRPVVRRRPSAASVIFSRAGAHQHQPVLVPVRGQIQHAPVQHFCRCQGGDQLCFEGQLPAGPFLQTKTGGQISIFQTDIDRKADNLAAPDLNREAR